MPPHCPSRLSPYAHLQPLLRAAKTLLVLSSLALAGCATTQQGAQYAESAYPATAGMLAQNANRQERANYLSQTQSDPLGAYLSSRENDYTIAENTQASKKTMVATALSMVGIRYRFGGEAPNTGFDCSGLVVYAAQKSLGLKLPRQSRQLAHQGIAVKGDELKRGDLVFFNTRGSRFSHVGIYLGDKKFVHAPRTGKSVRIESMDVAYWKKRYNGARRLTARAGGNKDLPPAN